jgi:small subunit ribosomal protein S16
MGSNKQPFFRVVVTDVRRSNRGTFLENVGWYDPKKKGINFSLDTDRIAFWVGRGAIVSDTVKSFLRKGVRAAKKSAETVKPAPASA